MTLSCAEVRDLAAGFVLGGLEPGEAASVRDHLATCAEAHAEFGELGGVVPYLADGLDPVEPPTALRGRILAAAAAARPDVAAVAAMSAAPVRVDRPIAAPAAPEAPRVIPLATGAERGATWLRRESRRHWSAWSLRIAAVLAIAVLGGWNLQLQARLSGVEDDLASARAYQQGVAAVLEIATQPGAQTAFLAAADPSTRATGVAAASPDGTVAISMRDLSPTVGAQVYEAWVIVGDAAPVPLGGFTVDRGGTGVFLGSTALAEPGAILALTLEPAAGATVPTLPVLTVGSLAASNS